MIRLKNLKNLLSTVMVISVLIITFNLSTTNNIINSLSEPKSNYHAYLHNWLYGDLIGVALSSINSDLKGYVGYDLVKETLIAGNLSNVAIQKTANLENIANTSIYTIGQLDLGLVDYVRASFLIFGFNTESFTHFYFLLLFISVSLYLVHFRNNNIAIFYLILFLYSHYIVVAALSFIGPQLETVFNFRFIPVLAVLPAMHILTAIISSKIMNTHSLLLVFIQSLIIIFVISIRSSALWISIFLLSFVIFTSGIIYSKQKIYNDKNGFELIKCKMIKINKKIWSIYPVLILLLLLKTIQPLFLNSVYNDVQVGHYKWHSIYLGMALHPEISNTYSGNNIQAKAQNWFNQKCDSNRVSDKNFKTTLMKWTCDHSIESESILKLVYYVLRPPDDQVGYSAAFKYLTDRGESELSLFRFNPEDKVDYQSAFVWFNDHKAPTTHVSQDDPERVSFNPYHDIKVSKYEEILKNISFDILDNHPLTIAETMLIIKPLKLLYHYVSNYSHSRNLPPAIITIFVFTYLMYLLRKTPPDDIKTFYKAMLLFLLFSLMIPIAIYSENYSISDVALLLNMCLIASIIIFLNFMLTLMKTKYIIKS
jgi:hypothetical protein